MVSGGNKIEINGETRESGGEITGAGSRENGLRKARTWMLKRQRERIPRHVTSSGQSIFSSPPPPGDAAARRRVPLERRESREMNLRSHGGGVSWGVVDYFTPSPSFSESRGDAEVLLLEADGV